MADHTRGGEEPRWRDDGREIVYLDSAGVVTAVAVRAEGETFVAETPQALFDSKLTLQRPDEIPDFLYAMTGDAQRFLINEPVPAAAADAAPPAMIKVVINWPARLESR